MVDTGRERKFEKVLLKPRETGPTTYELQMMETA